MTSIRAAVIRFSHLGTLTKIMQVLHANINNINSHRILHTAHRKHIYIHMEL